MNPDYIPDECELIVNDKQLNFTLGFTLNVVT
jgi:hypothetical protein